MNGSGGRELSSLGVTTNTRFEATVRINRSGTTPFTPQTVVVIGSDAEFVTRSSGDPATATVQFGVTSGSVNFSLGVTDPNNWPQRNVTASKTVDAIAIVNIAEVSGGQYDAMEDVALATNAQVFEPPSYQPPQQGPPKIQLNIAAPHFETDGQTVNTGQFQAFLPDKLLSQWGVSNPNQLTATAPAGSGTLTVTNVQGGVEVSLTGYHYSSGNVTVTTQNQPPNATFSANTTAVAPGEAIAFSANVSDPNGDSLNYSWDFGDGSTASSASVTHSYSNTGTYTVTLTASDGQGGSDTMTKNITVKSAGTGTPSDVTVGFATTTVSATPGRSTTVDIVANNIDNGVKSYGYTVTASNTTVATITRVNIVGASQGGVGVNVTITDDGSAAIVSVAQGDDNNGVFSTLTLSTQNVGTADLNISQVTLGDDDFSSYTITGTTNATIEVNKSAAPPAVVGNNRPTDPDGDGKFDDVTGDGRTNILDVGALLKNRNSPTIQNNPSKFDFTGDGRVNILDVGKLLQQVL